MIGLQEYFINNRISVIKLAEEIGIQPSAIWRWFKVNNVPNNHLDFLSNKFNINKEYINQKINDINMSHSRKKEFNEYEIIDNYVIIYIVNKKGEKFETYIDLEDFNKVKALNNPIHASYRKNNDNYYAAIHKYLGIIDGKPKYKTLLLHRVVTDASGNDYIDHVEQLHTLDNRKFNLRKTTNDKNLQSRKGANKNSGTGVRNVNWIEKQNEYWVQIMRKGERFKWIFPSTQFKEACDFADIKRKEIFGEFAGNS